MKRKVLNVMIALALALVPAGVLAGNAYAACGHGSTAKDQVLNGIGETGSSCDDSNVLDAVTAATNILSIIAGAAAVLMIVLSGFKYITSGGDANKVSNAKHSLIYALIGIVVVVLAQLMVRIVITQSNQAGLPACPADHHIRPPDCHN